MNECDETEDTISDLNTITKTSTSTPALPKSRSTLVSFIEISISSWQEKKSSTLAIISTVTTFKFKNHRSRSHSHSSKEKRRRREKNLRKKREKIKSVHSRNRNLGHTKWNLNFVGVCAEWSNLAIITAFMEKASLFDLLLKIHSLSHGLFDLFSSLLINILPHFFVILQNIIHSFIHFFVRWNIFIEIRKHLFFKTGNRGFGLDWTSSMALHIHRDLKSGNVLINEHLIAKVYDFALGRRIVESHNRNMPIQVGSSWWVSQFDFIYWFQIYLEDFEWIIWHFPLLLLLLLLDDWLNRGHLKLLLEGNMISNVTCWVLEWSCVRLWWRSFHCIQWIGRWFMFMLLWLESFLSLFKWFHFKLMNAFKIEIMIRMPTWMRPALSPFSFKPNHSRMESKNYFFWHQKV